MEQRRENLLGPAEVVPVEALPREAAERTESETPRKGEPCLFGSLSAIVAKHRKLDEDKNGDQVYVCAALMGKDAINRRRSKPCCQMPNDAENHKGRLK